MKHFDIRKKREKKVSFKFLWMKEMFEKIRLMISPDELSNEELQKYLMKVYDECYQPMGRFMNNISKTNKKMSLETFIYILNQRKYYKNKMNEYEYGSDEYIYYNVMQLTYKVLANSYYKIMA